MPDNQPIIYHNPRCSKSREALKILEDNGHLPEIIEYLSEPHSTDQIRDLISMLGISPRDILRTGEEAYKALNLADVSISDNDIISAICQYPALLERPIVINGQKAVIGRPPVRIIDIL
ncbi:MAG: arsenate reductase [Gammaproteobacteria bacterium]|jgi:arsenate reductase